MQVAWALHSVQMTEKHDTVKGSRILVENPEGMIIELDRVTAVNVGRVVAAYGILCGALDPERIERGCVGSVVRCSDHAKKWCVLSVVNYKAWNDVVVVATLFTCVFKWPRGFFFCLWALSYPFFLTAARPSGVRALLGVHEALRCSWRWCAVGKLSALSPCDTHHSDLRFFHQCTCGCVCIVVFVWAVPSGPGQGVMWGLEQSLGYII